jgi:hypothetical protein
MREEIGMLGSGVCPEEVEAFVDQGIGSGHYTRNGTAQR